MAHIAVVEDELVIGTLLAMVLEAHGETVERFESAEAFLAAAPARGFDLILLDLNLPGMGGLECLSLLRARGVARTRAGTSPARTTSARSATCASRSTPSG